MASPLCLVIVRHLDQIASHHEACFQAATAAAAAAAEEFRVRSHAAITQAKANGYGDDIFFAERSGTGAAVATPDCAEVVFSVGFPGVGRTG